MDRSVFSRPFSKENIPVWRCPTCGQGRLTLMPDSLIAREGSDSRLAHDHPGGGPEWINYRFSCMFLCDSKSCGDFVACAGTGSLDHFGWFDENTGQEEESYEDFFTPKLFVPPLVLMDIPERCPEAVCIRLKQSFAMFFADPGGAMNAGRAAVEALMTELGVARYTNSKGKRHPIPLHKRIEKLSAKYATPLKEMLIAVKWLGNAGSHDGQEPEHEHVRLMYDMLEHCLTEIYDNKGKKLKALAKQVNKKKGI